MLQKGSERSVGSMRRRRRVWLGQLRRELSGERQPRRQQHRQRMQHLQRQRGRGGDLRHAAMSSRRRSEVPLSWGSTSSPATRAAARSPPLPMASASGSRPPRRGASRSLGAISSPAEINNINDGGGWGGGAYWAGGGRQWRTGDTTETDGPFFSNYWGWQMVCGSSSGCNQNAGIALNSVLLTAAESQGPSSSPSGANNLLYQTRALRLEPRRASPIPSRWRRPTPLGCAGSEAIVNGTGNPGARRVARHLAVAPVPRRVLDRRRRGHRRHSRVRARGRHPHSAAPGHQRRPGHDHGCCDAEGRQRPGRADPVGPDRRRLGRPGARSTSRPTSPPGRPASPERDARSTAGPARFTRARARRCRCRGWAPTS